MFICPCFCLPDCIFAEHKLINMHGDGNVLSALLCVVWMLSFFQKKYQIAFRQNEQLEINSLTFLQVARFWENRNNTGDLTWWILYKIAVRRVFCPLLPRLPVWRQGRTSCRQRRDAIHLFICRVYVVLFWGKVKKINRCRGITYSEL